MVEIDVNDNWAQQSQSERREPSGQQANPAQHLKGSDGVKVTAVSERAHEGRGITLHRRHRYKM